MADFQTSFSVTSANEGGYANNPRDKGGQTYRGIARNFWPGWKGWPMIDEALAAHKSVNGLAKKLDGLVAEFYTDQFWRPLGCDRLESQLIAGELFDTGVNMGIKQAARFLQEALVILGNDKITVDGIIGAKTIAAANAADSELLLITLNLLQGSKYLDIVRRDPSQRVFLRGWLRRAVPKTEMGKVE